MDPAAAQEELASQDGEVDGQQNRQTIYPQPFVMVGPPPPPRTPRMLNYGADCATGVAVGGSEAHVGRVQVDQRNLWPALDACWNAVWNKFPSPEFPDMIAEGFQLGVASGNRGECFAEFGLDGYQAKDPQDSDWITCNARGKVAVYSKLPPPPPPPPPKPPPSPPPWSAQSGGDFVAAYGCIACRGRTNAALL